MTKVSHDVHVDENLHGSLLWVKLSVVQYNVWYGIVDLLNLTKNVVGVDGLTTNLDASCRGKSLVNDTVGVLSAYLVSSSTPYDSFDVVSE